MAGTRHDIGNPARPSGRRGLAALLLFGLSLAGCATLEGGIAQDRTGAEAAYRAGDYPRAAALYATVTERSPSSAEDWYRLGNARSQLGALEAAAEAYRQALRRDEGFAQARHNLGLVYLQLGVQAIMDARGGLPLDTEAEGSARYLMEIMEAFRGPAAPEGATGSATQ